MAGQWKATVVIDRPIEAVFAFLADGENDRKFSPRFWRSPRRRKGRRASVRSMPAPSGTLA
jgi:uncharacterized protein YndB with AHSA1/START domain